MKKVLVVAVITLFLMSFVAAGITASAINNNSEEGNGEQNQIQANTENQGEETELEVQNRIKEKAGNKLTNEQIKEVFTSKNRIKNQYANQSECPEKCTCTGSVTKCQLNNGTREMTVTAGKSGKIIIQVKDVNGSVEVTLYKTEDGKLYVVTKNNETKRIRLLPDQVRERIKEKLEKKFEKENITLNEDGMYQYEAKKRARLFFIFPVREKVQAELNPETGKIMQVRNPWWGFLAKDEKTEPILGASCGTVTPGMNDECCQNKGYDFWNSETNECEFNAEE